jgi:hypothetical protein
MAALRHRRLDLDCQRWNSLEAWETASLSMVVGSQLGSTRMECEALRKSESLAKEHHKSSSRETAYHMKASEKVSEA